MICFKLRCQKQQQNPKNPKKLSRFPKKQVFLTQKQANLEIFFQNFSSKIFFLKFLLAEIVFVTKIAACPHLLTLCSRLTKRCKQRKTVSSDISHKQRNRLIQVSLVNTISFEDWCKISRLLKNQGYQQKNSKQIDPFFANHLRHLKYTNQICKQSQYPELGCVFLCSFRNCVILDSEPEMQTAQLENQSAKHTRACVQLSITLRVRQVERIKLYDKKRIKKQLKKSAEIEKEKQMNQS